MRVIRLPVGTAEKTAFVVSPINWEYNDEINYEAGLEGPEGVFTTAAAAVERAEALTARSIKGLELSEYLGEDVDTKALRKVARLIGANKGDEEMDDDDLVFIIVPESVSDTVAQQVSELLDLHFYQVHEVAMEG